jgi:hypothetical protein
MFLTILWWVMILGFTGALILSSIRTIAKVHFAIVTRFGKRTGRVLHEGLNFIWPFVDSVEDPISTELVPQNFAVEFTTRDQVALGVKGAMQYRPSAEIRDKHGRNVFVAVSPKSRESGLNASIQGLLSNLGGLHDSTDFVGKKGILELMLRCILELENQPHDEESVPVDEMFAWYQRNALGVSQKLNDANKSSSPVEKTYGIDIVTVVVAEVKFPKEIEDAQQDKRETQLRGEAIQDYINAQKQLIDTGLSPQEAWRGVLSVMKPGVSTSVAEGDLGASVIDALRGKK